MSRGSRTDVVAARATSYHRDTSGLPSSTVVSIGGGFVAFALSILAILTSVRAFRLLFEAKRKSRNGEPTTFAQLWEREGGFWGFITGLGGESSAGGAGFIDVGRQRRWEEMLRRERWMIDLMDIEGDVGETPRLWEVPVEEKEAIEEDEVEVEQCHPLSVSTSLPPDLEDGIRTSETTDPILNLSLLILLPSPPSKTRVVGSDEENDELPELVVGTTIVLPHLQPAVVSTTHDEDSKFMESRDEKVDEEKAEVPNLSYSLPSSSGPRRAVWERTDKGWRIEGFDGT